MGVAEPPIPRGRARAKSSHLPVHRTSSVVQDTRRCKVRIARSDLRRWRAAAGVRLPEPPLWPLLHSECSTHLRPERPDGSQFVDAATAVFRRTGACSRSMPRSAACLRKLHEPWDAPGEALRRRAGCSPCLASHGPTPAPPAGITLTRDHERQRHERHVTKLTRPCCRDGPPSRHQATWRWSGRPLHR
jgi:hypothetical protein